MQSCATVHIQCSVLSLATSAFSFAALKCSSLVSVPISYAWAGMLSQFQRKHSLSAWGSSDASLQVQSSQPSGKRLESERRKNPNKTRSLGTPPHKAPSDTDGRRCAAFATCELREKHSFWGMRGLLLLLAAVTASGKVAVQHMEERKACCTAYTIRPWK